MLKYMLDFDMEVSCGDIGEILHQELSLFCCCLFVQLEWMLQVYMKVWVCRATLPQWDKSEFIIPFGPVVQNKRGYA